MKPLDPIAPASRKKATAKTMSRKGGIRRECVCSRMIHNRLKVCPHCGAEKK